MKLIGTHSTEKISEFLGKMRTIVYSKVEHYQADLAIDVEMLLLDSRPERVVWSVGDMGTHMMCTQHYFEAVKANYGSTDVYILDLKELTVTKAAWDDETKQVLPDSWDINKDN